MVGLRASPEPGEVSVESGLVLLDGPNGIAASLTPEAAEETGRRLIDAANAARREVPAPPPDT